MTAEERKKRLQELEEEKQIHLAEMELKNIKSNASRARSITVGTAFGGITEVSMRGDGVDILWCLLQPVEVTELIHQLAGNIGCHINLQPRNDFSSWREWKDVSSNLLSFHPPHPNDLDKFNHVGTSLPAPVNNTVLDKNNNLRNEDESLAITKNINKRKSKRPATST